MSDSTETAVAPADGSDAADALATFSALWALAAMWHVLSSPANATPTTQLLLAVGVLVAIAWPGAAASLVILSVGVLATMWSEAPFLGNHWLLAGFVSIGILGSVLSTTLAGRSRDRGLLAARVLPVARACLLAFYVFAAFAKLNSGFFDRSVSCGVVYFRESTESIGLAGLRAGGNAAVEWAVILGTVAIELTIPALLVWRRTRHPGVVLALTFHGILALDRAHVFVDFSSMLAALFVCFLPAPSLASATRLVRHRLAGLAADGRHVPLVARLVAAAVPSAMVAAVASRDIEGDLVVELRWWSWQAASVALVAMVVRHLWRARPAPERHVVQVRPLILLAVPLLVVANGLTPYLELKTSYGWNMYANLRTVDGDANHYIVRRTLPLTDEQADPVRIISSSDPLLQSYADDGFTLAWSSLRDHLARHPEAAISYERGGRVVQVERAAERPELVDGRPGWRQKVQAFRSADAGSPERCQTFIRPLG